MSSPRRSGAPALRRRRARAHQPHEPRCRRDVNDPGLPQRHVRRAASRPTCEAARGAGRGRRRPAPDRDHLRHAQRQGGDLRGAVDCSRRSAARLPIVDLRHDHRRLGPHALGPDGRGVLELGAPRAAAVRRAQLRARRRAAAAVRRGAGAASPTPTSAPIPTRGSPMPSASTTRAPEQTAEILGEFAEAGLVNIVGGCCGTTPQHIRARARGGRAARAAQAGGAAGEAAGSPGSSRSTSTTTACSSTSASVPTSPARRSSAS